MDFTFDAALIQRLQILFIALLFGYMASWIAWREGYYQLPFTAGRSESQKISSRRPFVAFAIFLTVELVIVPSMYLIWLFMRQGDLSLEKEPLDVFTKGWLNIIGIFCTALFLGIYFKMMDKESRRLVWGDSKGKGRFKPVLNFLVGMFSCFLAFPWIVALSQLTGIILQFSYQGPHIEQVAVRHIRETMSNSLLFFFTIFAVITIVPIVEELLFRGFLQGWLKGLLSRGKAILITSAVFALFHFSPSQGMENIDLLLSLFLLSCYLGFLRERQGSLLASIGLHATFNAISIFFLILGSAS